MTPWPRIRKRLEREFPDEVALRPKQFKSALKFLKRKLEDNPAATKEEIERAATREGIDPITLAVLSLILTVAIEIWRAWARKE